jgi:hypothetical protein
MQITNSTLQSNIFSPIKKELPLLGNVAFWLFYIRKDYKRIGDAILLKGPERIQKKWIVRAKVVGDSFRLIDVLGRRFDTVVPKKLCNTVRGLGLLAGALDSANEQILSYRELKKEFTAKNTFNFLSSIFFNGFCISSLLSMRCEVKKNSSPLVMISLMAVSIIGSSFSPKSRKNN